MRLKCHTQVCASDGTTTLQAGGVDYYPFGLLYAISYVKASSNAYVDGVRFSFLTDPGIPFWDETGVNASKTVCPRIGAVDYTNTAVNWKSGTPLYRMPMLTGSLPFIFRIIGGGTGKTGTMHLIMLEHTDYMGSLE